MNDQKYVRVYYSICDDPKFVEVYPDDRLLATWLRLLILADGVYPASAPIPRSVSPRALRKLADLRIIDLAGDYFRLHGLDAERARRAAAARVGGMASGNARRTTVERPLNERSKSVRLETNLDETRRDETSTRRDESGPRSLSDEIHATNDPMVAYADRIGTWPTGRLSSWINDLGAKYSDTRLAELINATPMETREAPNTYLGRIAQALAQRAHEAQRAEEAAEAARLREKRATPPRPRLMPEPDPDPETFARDMAAAEAAGL